MFQFPPNKIRQSSKCKRNLILVKDLFKDFWIYTIANLEYINNV